MIWVPGILCTDRTWLTKELKNVITLYLLLLLLLFVCGGCYCGDPGVEDNLFRVRIFFLQRKPIHSQVVRPAVFTVDRNNLGSPRMLIALHNYL